MEAAAATAASIVAPFGMPPGASPVLAQALRKATHTMAGISRLNIISVSSALNQPPLFGNHQVVNCAQSTTRQVAATSHNPCFACAASAAKHRVPVK
jgi:hypothetical protein